MPAAATVWDRITLAGNSPTPPVALTLAATANPSLSVALPALMASLSAVGDVYLGRADGGVALAPVTVASGGGATCACACA